MLEELAAAAHPALPHPRQNELATALREVGRIERSLFMIERTTDPDIAPALSMVAPGLLRTVGVRPSALRSRAEGGSETRGSGLAPNAGENIQRSAASVVVEVLAP